jgi:hypothetical protein
MMADNRSPQSIFVLSRNARNRSGLLLGTLLLVFLSACRTPAQLDEISGKNTGRAPAAPTAQTPPKADVPLADRPVPAAPVRADTSVVLDTIRRASETLVVKQFFVEGKKVKTDTLRQVADQPRNFLPNPKSSYTLAVILPFRSGEYAERGSLSKRSYLALDFYEGMKMAVADLQKSEEMDIRILVLDSEPDSLGIEPVLQRPELLEADAIMGPVNTEQLRLVADWAKVHGKPLVSPINPKEFLVRDNPFYVQLNPGARTQLIAQLDYARERYGKSARYILACPRDSMASEMAKALQTHFRGVGDDRPMIEYIVHRDSFQWADFRENLSTTDTNVVIVPSSDEVFVPELLRALSSTTTPEPTYPLAVFGTQRWYGLNRIGMDDLENLHVFIPMETFLSSVDPTVVQWRYRFFQTYRFPPSEYACKGYDYTRFVCRMLKKYGTHFPHHARNETADYISCPGFDLQAIIDAVPPNGEKTGRVSVRQFENRRVNILQFRDYRYQKAH